MKTERMGNADMIQYCNEALAWTDLGPIDVYFFQSVKNILLGKCSAAEDPDDYQEDLMGMERPVRDVELEPEYGNYADIYYGEEGEDDIPNYCLTEEDEAFADQIFGGGFFDKPDDAEGDGGAEKDAEKQNEEKAEDEAESEKHSVSKGDSFTVNI